MCIHIPDTLLLIHILGARDKGEVFKLMFRFDANYPISAAAVQFVTDQTAEASIHPHIYSNGHPNF
ncbi:hypothetical protein BKA83DRAFT_4225898 [Pisolithus microcarpus]|nr:hypothetical protein BKA83DRAFT_4274519 [Pisolithus microcarpus]KAI6027263.1 hypothetical protein BKA83DRAFT_4225898 [Pisolithus microcarpus]